MKVFEKLLNVQANLKAPKGQFNSFGKYNYRSCEDIMEAVKPLLNDNKLSLIVSDQVELIGDRTYIKATATVYDIETGESTNASAYAREDDTKKGMDLAQVTGSVSSYARKYALNGLFCIDDTKDSDSTNTHDKTSTSSTGTSAETPSKSNKELSEKQINRLLAIAKAAGYDLEAVKKHAVNKYKTTQLNLLTKAQYDEFCANYEKLKK